jgi:hypothetical protein
MGGTPSLPSLFLFSQLLVVGTIRFLLCCVLEQVDPTANYEHTQDPTQGHERDERIKLLKLPKMIAIGLTLVLSTPSLKGPGLTLEFRSTP